LNKATKTDSLPDISAVTSEGGKKAKVSEKGVVSLKGKKGDEEFDDFSFKEGNTAVLKVSDIYA
jgi:hypothetical protein